MSSVTGEGRIIFALDCADEKEARKWVERLWPEIIFFKVGLELFLAAGWQIVEQIQSRGGKVMLDLKFLDIPNTVTRAVQQCVGRGISFITVHGHLDTVKAAIKGREKDPMQILAVTLLTCQADLSGFNLKKEVQQEKAKRMLVKRARDSWNAGCDGLVGSSLDAKILRDEFGEEPILVTPGVRDKDDVKNDHIRSSDAATAIAAGSDYLVIGRPIRLAEDPLAKVRLIKEQIAGISQ